MRSGEICPAQILRHQLHQLALRREAELTGFLLEPKFLPDDLTVLPLLIKLDQRVGFLIPSDVLCLETLSFVFFIPVTGNDSDVIRQVRDIAGSRDLIPSRR